VGVVIAGVALAVRAVNRNVDGATVTLGQVLRERTDKSVQLEEKLRQIKAREQAVDARRRILESQRKRKDDTRRKILVGAIVLAKMDQGERDSNQLRRWLDQALTRIDDRGLFGLGSSERA
jgi:hypothetical protein